MFQGEPLLFAVLASPLPVLGTIPRVVRWLCEEQRTRRALVAVISIATIGVTLWLIGAINRGLLVAFVAPVYQLALIHQLYRRFLSRHGREPIDVAFNFDSGLWHDRVFALGVSLGGLLPVFGALALDLWVSGPRPAV